MDVARDAVLGLDYDSSWTSQPTVPQRAMSPQVERRTVNTSQTVALDSSEFAKFFAQLAKEGTVDRITLHLPAGVAYGIGRVRQTSGVNDVDFQGRVTKLYATALVVLAMVFGILITLGATQRINLFDLSLSVCALMAVMIATVTEWKGWRRRGR